MEQKMCEGEALCSGVAAVSWRSGDEADGQQCN
jgi:hypothetical protein